jgi:hypothetical protein
VVRTARQLGFIGMCLWAAHAGAVDWAVPVDIRQGALLGGSDPKTPYRLEMTALAAIDLNGVVRFGLGGMLAKTNPNWDGGPVLSVSHLFPLLSLAGTPLTDLGVRVEARGAYLVSDSRWLADGGAAFELAGLLRLGLTAGYDFRDARTYVLTTIGFDVIALVRVVRGPQPTPAPTPDGRGQPPTDEDLLASGVRSRVLGLTDPSRGRICRWVRSFEEQMEGWSLEQTERRAAEAGLPDLVNAVRDAIRESPQLVPELQTRAVHRGLRDAAGELQREGQPCQ